jgi:adenylosuccinate lyase
MDINLFDCISPLDFRYYGPVPRIFEKLSPYLSERARVAYELKVEVALVKVLARRGICSESVLEEIAKAAGEVTVEEVAQEEERIKHNIRALVNTLQSKVSPTARPYVHFTTTSFDIIDTATAARLRDCVLNVILPDCLQLERTLIALARREKDSLQMGRTHGQHAVPITFGFAVAEYVSRFGGRIEAIRNAANRLPGKISGAVGAYNASSIFFDDPEEFEREALAELGLKPAPHSTQIVEPEWLCDLAHAVVSAFGVLANFADDMRHLQRSEIAEVGEAFGKEQVGSSTMPHKRNPWNFENVKSMYKAFMPRMMTVYLDQISEHQRDLTNSASQRFLPEILAAFECCVDRLIQVCERLVIDAKAMRRNFEQSAAMVVAEPAYILLAAHGHPDAHEAVRLLTLNAQESKRPVTAIMEKSKDLKPYLDQFTPQQRAILADASKYTGIASQKAEAVCDLWEERLGLKE